MFYLRLPVFDLEPLLFVPSSINSHWIYTMYRCLIAAAAALSFALPAAAQVQRNFPQNALRGTITFGAPPLVQLNGKSTQLSPGSRIRGENNLLVMSGALVGAKGVVNYTIDQSGLVKDVWLLRKEEVAVKPWPETLEQAQAWEFDPAAQTWTKP
jgi:hypothetical protein